MFQSITDLSQNVGEYLTYSLHFIEALDPERNLCLSTTSGRTRGARRWFVFRYDPERYAIDYRSERVVFRAWTLAEALEKANQDKRTVNRIQKVFSPLP